MAVEESTLKEIESATRAVFEPLTNEQLILKALASLVSHNLPQNTYYSIMANVLRERSKWR